MLENIKSPSDIKNLSQKEVEKLAEEIRKTIISTVSKTGGHLASNLGVVELTIALHRVFNSPKDAIVWDVSHQCYAHKLLTGRYEQFNTLRQEGGISGFTNKYESEHDFFINGHSSTSISSALGLLAAKDILKKEGKVIAVIGDGALTGGMAFEGLSNAGQMNKNLIVVLNDNQMSIDHNTGAVSRYLSRLSMSSRYQNFRYRTDKIINKLPYFNKHLEKLIFRMKRSLKGLLLTNNLFTDLGFEYVGPLDGHNEQSLEKVFKTVEKLHRPVVVHVVTKKGKGYDLAEKNPENYHGVSSFDVETGIVPECKKLTFTDAFSQIILEEGKNNQKIAAITAAMAQGTGLVAFEKEFPNRFFDVGIAEEHAVTFAGGLSEGGMLPVVCIYSTFIQRAVDQLIHDISLQHAPSIFILDRSGAVPNDGVTHQGIFDIALFKPIPYIKMLAPASKKDLELCFKWAENSKNPVIIRYPKTCCPEEISEYEIPVEEGKGILIKNKIQKAQYLIVCTGGMIKEVMSAVESAQNEKLYADIYSLRFIKPFNFDYFNDFAKEYKGIVFVEDGIKTGGISEEINSYLQKQGLLNTKILAFDEKYYEHGTREQILKAAGMDSQSIVNTIKELANVKD